MLFKTSDNITIDYHQYGHATDPAVVLVAGFGGLQQIWTAQIDYLLALHRQVITYDQRNAGASQRTTKNLTIHRLALDLQELIQHCQLTEPLLIGHSMGASVCWAYSAISSNWRATMTIDQSPKMLNDASWTFGFCDYTAANYQQKSQTAPVTSETLHGLDAAVSRELLPAKQRYPFDRGANQPLLWDHFVQDWRPTLLAATKPIEFVCASQSPYYQLGYGTILAQQNPQLNSVTIDNCGHVIMAEVPAAFNQTLRHFVLKNR